MLLAAFLIFAAALVQGAVGFGFALTAMPVLALLMDVKDASALVALSAFTLSAIMLAQNRKDVHFGEAAGLIGSALVGIPFGIFLLARAPQQLVLLILGGTIAAFAVYALVSPKPPQLKSGLWRYGFGYVGGVLGGAYNTSGPPVVVYSAMRSWPHEKFVAVTQAFFTPTYLMIVAGHGLSGLWTREILTIFAISAPGILAATIIGKRIAGRLPVKALSRAVYGLLLVLGLAIVGTNL